MNLQEALAIEDSYDGMLEIACLLAEKAAHVAESDLSPEEQHIRLVTWVDCQVCNGGWEQWMANTSVRGLAATLDALNQVGCSQTREIASAALAAASVDVANDSEEAKDRRLDELTEGQRYQLSTLDARFYDSAEDYMKLCHDYIVANRAAFSE